MTHLLRRNAAAETRGFTRIERGTAEELVRIREISRERAVRVKIFIVQPDSRKPELRAISQNS